MRYRRLDDNDDYVFGQGSQNFLINSPNAVAQAVKTSLRLFQGEWFLDTTAGIPWFTKVTGYNLLYDAVIRDAIQSVQGIKDILDYSSSVVGRTLSITVKIDTQFGPVVTTLILEAKGGYGVGGYGEGGYGL